VISRRGATGHTKGQPQSGLPLFAVARAAGNLFDLWVVIDAGTDSHDPE
jgi:hypothetical protein